MKPVRRKTLKPRPGPEMRDERFTARLSQGEKSLLQRAAALRGQTLSAYVFEKARHAAVAELEDAGEIVLAAEARQEFVRLVLDPPTANSKLRSALRAALRIAANGPAARTAGR